MTPRFRHGLLDPRPLPAAGQTNDALLGPRTLGVEVTEPRLAAACGLGNIDPQHRPDGGAVAAIEAALDWPLPPPRSILVTIRPDADAFGAMAVLELRAAGVPLPPEMHERIDLIARADRFDNGPWPGRRALPDHATAIDEVGPGPLDLGALIAGVSDRTLNPADAVAAAQAWIVAGVVPSAWRETAARAAEALFNAYRSEHVLLQDAHPGRVAIVRGCVPGALRLGYRLAPVVVAVDEAPRGEPPEPWRRITIAQWSVGHVDLVRAVALLAAGEPGWGGSPSIIGSPQGRPSLVAIPDVLAVLHACGA